MSFYTPSKLPDVATETITSLGQSIDLVGMTNIQLPIMIEVQNEVKTVLSRCNVFVNLCKEKTRGIHMSRLYNIVIEKTQQNKIDLNTLPELLSLLIQSHSKYSTHAKLEFNFDLCLKQSSLLSNLEGFRYYPITISAEKNNTKTIYDVSFKILYSSTCPCSAALSRQSIKEKFKSDFSNSTSIEIDDVANWLNSQDNINATPHAQRSEATISLQFSNCEAFNLELMIKQIENVLKTPVQTAVKREDEKEFAKLNAKNLMFCEDAIRKIDQFLNTQFFLNHYSIEVNHFESLHSHNASAKISNKKPQSNV